MTADRRATVCLAALAISLLAPAPATDPKTLGRTVVALVADHFLDRDRANAWAATHNGYADAITDPRAFAVATNAALAELKTSHTRLYTPDDVAYYGLMAIFAPALKRPAPAFESIGVDLAEGRYVRRVFAGGPGEAAGLRRGDEIVGADQRPLVEVATFRGQSARQVALAVRRRAADPLIEVRVKPRTVVASREWAEAQEKGTRRIARGGKSIGYVPIFSGAGDVPKEDLRSQFSGELRDADALVLDFRDGWGGSDPDFVSLFDPRPPVLTFVERDGKRRIYDAAWRKPLVVLINGGTRSGKEVVARAIQKHRLGTLVGTRTAGAVAAGQPFLLADGSLLVLAVADVLADGERLEGVGVAPDVEVPDALPYADGADPQLDAALDAAVKAVR
ncbi:MAG TPA: S41 family peptidase [Isosphaeraceae bacterium]